MAFHGIYVKFLGGNQINKSIQLLPNPGASALFHLLPPHALLAAVEAAFPQVNLWEGWWGSLLESKILGSQG